MKIIKSWFTLVELIIVITILSILSTIWFVSYSKYNSNSRDSVRLSNLSSLNNSLLITKESRQFFPNPWDIFITSWIENIHQELFDVWYITKDVSNLLNFPKNPQDPLNSENILYWLTKDNRYFQVATVLENWWNPVSKLNWNYNWIFKFKWYYGDYISNLPSLILSKPNIYPESVFITDGWNNLPYLVSNEVLSTPQLQTLTWILLTQDTDFNQISSYFTSIPKEQILKEYNYNVVFNNSKPPLDPYAVSKQSADWKLQVLNNWIIKCNGAQPWTFYNFEWIDYRIASDIDDLKLKLLTWPQLVPSTNICTTHVTTFYQLFNWNSKFNDDLYTWDVSNVTNMDHMFRSSIFNKNINTWDVSSVTSMVSTFKWSKFNQPLDNWNTSNVVKMISTFELSEFNQPLNWNLEKIDQMPYFISKSKMQADLSKLKIWPSTNLVYIFHGSDYNNPSLNDLDISQVTNINNMFAYSKFNQPLDKWDTSKIISMHSIFLESEFNQDLNWDLSSLKSPSNMFKWSKMQWDISKVKLSSWTVLSNIFASSDYNNPSLNNLDVSMLTNMSNIFATSTYNQPLDKWNPQSAINMSWMFKNSVFNQDISNWNVTKVTSFIDFSTWWLLQDNNKPLKFR